MNCKTVFDEGFKILGDNYQFKYQEELTLKLDASKTGFDQNKLNEIVLWKVNRYAHFDELTIKKLNSIELDRDEIDEDITRELLQKLLNTKGVQLPMASTILRFRNPKIYQIIDQRVFRIIYGKRLELKSYRSDENIERQIDLYFKYLVDLRNVCLRLNIEFQAADRILYMADKRVNSKSKLANY